MSRFLEFAEDRRRDSKSKHAKLVYFSFRAGRYLRTKSTSHGASRHFCDSQSDTSKTSHMPDSEVGRINPEAQAATRKRVAAENWKMKKKKN